MEAAEPATKKAAWKSWVAAGVVTAAFAGGAIIAVSVAGGSKDTPTTTPAAAATGHQGSEGSGGAGNGPTFAAQRGVRGTITAIDGTTLTLDSTDPSGETSTVTVETTDETAFRETVEGTLADVAVGDNIVAMGTRATPGSPRRTSSTTATTRPVRTSVPAVRRPTATVTDATTFPDGGPGGGGNAPGGGRSAPEPAASRRER